MPQKNLLTRLDDFVVFLLSVWSEITSLDVKCTPNSASEGQQRPFEFKMAHLTSLRIRGAASFRIQNGTSDVTLDMTYALQQLAMF